MDYNSNIFPLYLTSNHHKYRYNLALNSKIKLMMFHRKGECGWKHNIDHLLTLSFLMTRKMNQYNATIFKFFVEQKRDKVRSDPSLNQQDSKRIILSDRLKVQLKCCIFYQQFFYLSFISSKPIKHQILCFSVFTLQGMCHQKSKKRCCCIILSKQQNFAKFETLLYCPANYSEEKQTKTISITQRPCNDDLSMHTLYYFQCLPPFASHCSTFSHVSIYTNLSSLLDGDRCIGGHNLIMSRVQIDNITIVNPKAVPCDPIRLAVTFTALTALPRILSWKITYVGSAFSQDYDQILEEFQIGPIEEASTMSFTAECDPPQLVKVPRQELLCTTALIMSVSYDQQEFTRIGYYVLNTYRGEVEDASMLELQEVLAHVDRIIIHEKPRITKFQIQWDAQTTNQNKDRKAKEDSQRQEKEEREEYQYSSEQKESLAAQVKESEEVQHVGEQISTPQRLETDI